MNLTTYLEQKDVNFSMYFLKINYSFIFQYYTSILMLELFHFLLNIKQPFYHFYQLILVNVSNILEELFLIMLKLKLQFILIYFTILDYAPIVKVELFPLMLTTQLMCNHIFYSNNRVQELFFIAYYNICNIP